VSWAGGQTEVDAGAAAGGHCRDMRSLLVVLVLTVAACGGKSKPATPTDTTPKVEALQGPVTPAGLTTYFTTRFAAQVQAGVLAPDFGSSGVVDDVVKELAIMGVDDLSELPALVPADFDTKGFGAIKASSSPTTNLAGLLRDLMLIRDIRLYFEKAWNNGWASNGPEDFPAPAAYGVDFGIMQELGVFGGGEDPCGGWDGDEGDPCGE